jgi:hypothetical protein
MSTPKPKKMKKRIQEISKQLQTAGGAAYGYMEDSDWQLIIHEITTEIKGEVKSDFEIALLKGD